MRETAFLTLLLLITHISLKALFINIVAHILCGNLKKRASSLFLKPNDLDREMFSAMRSEGDIIDFMLSAKRDQKAAERLFRRALKAVHAWPYRVINMDQNVRSNFPGACSILFR